MGKGCRNALIALFMSILILPSVIWGVLNVLDAAGVLSMEAFDTDTGEKRDKAELDGLDEDVDTVQVLTDYYNDRLPFRSGMILLNRRINSRIERSYKTYVDNIYSGGKSVEDIVEQASVSVPEKNGTVSEGTVAGNDETGPSVPAESKINSEETLSSEEETLTEEESAEQIPEPEEVTEQAEEPEDPEASEYEEVDISSLPYFPLRIYNDQVIEGRDRWLFYGIQTNRDNYEGRAIPGEQQLASYASVMTETRNVCNDAGKEFRVLICPDKETIYPEYYPTVEFSSDYRRPQVIYDYMKANTDVGFLYPKDELKSAKRVCRLYYAYDSHWNGAGGYVGSRSLLGSLGIELKSLYDCAPAECVPVSGDLVLLGNLDIADYDDDVDYYIDSNPDATIMSVNELAEDGKVEEYVSTAQNKKKLVIIGDSYSEQMMRYIADEFARVTFIHKLSADNPAAGEVIRNADIIVIESVERNVKTVTETAESVMRQLRAGE